MSLPHEGFVRHRLFIPLQWPLVYHETQTEKQTPLLKKAGFVIEPRLNTKPTLLKVKILKNVLVPSPVIVRIFDATKVTVTGTGCIGFRCRCFDGVQSIGVKNLNVRRRETTHRRDFIVMSGGPRP